ncbi:MAG TPA: protein kinase [Acidimicrobiales bacterium]|nr:protein kinase [Acidimicrobiales bacterium]
MSVVRASELVGRVVGRRYRLLRPLGSGASAHVYVAEDVRLRRRTAVKVLHPALARDRSFLRRFQAEAQTVAALRHPGIVRVYDWGEDGDEAYLVMELLEGGSLRGLLDTGYRLSVSQATALGLDIAAALAYAHARGLVHRDIKPANLLFDEEGHASVVDFGIARALAEASWTEPAGGLIGTARYAAPEQLTGQPLDGKADVYALALVLVEAVSGQVPFALDTTLGALMARASTPLRAPAELEALAPLIERAGAVYPEERLSAEAMGEEIASIARRLRAPAPLPMNRGPSVADPDAGPRTALGLVGERPPGAGLSIMAGDLELVADVGDEDLPWGTGTPAAAEGGEGLVEADLGANGPGLVRDGLAPEEGEEDVKQVAEELGPAALTDERRDRLGRRPPNRRRRRARWAAAFLAFVALAGGGATVAIYLDQPPPPPPTYPVPDLSRQGLVAAGALLAKDHLQLAVTARQWSPTTPKGTVMSQYPPSGARLLADRTVDVTVSLGPEPVGVPSLATLDLAQARAFLSSAGLRLGDVTKRTSITVPEGLVITWSGRGQRVLPGSAVNIVISLGKPMAMVPASAVGAPFVQVRAELSALGFQVQEASSYSGMVKAGMVISTNPPPGSQNVIGTVVIVDVSLGPHLVTIPGSIVGLSVEQAARVLSGIGLYVSRVSGSPLLPVGSTEPPLGTAAVYGSSVVLITSG